MVAQPFCRRYRDGVKLVGIDLSWTGRRPSGLALIDGTGPGAMCHSWTATLGPGEAADWLDSLGPNVVACVDAPLRTSEGRRAEAALAQALGMLGVTAYGVDPGFLERRGLRAGPTLGSLLATAGWSFEPPRGAIEGGRYAFETFPRALTLTLLGLARPPDYKRGRLAERTVALQQYWAGLDGACERAGIAIDVPAPTPGPDGACASGRELKGIEDRLDAVACALAALNIARGGLESGDCFGSAAEGLIVVPGAARVTSARAPTSP
jgi:predicted RNase H-like nuclease